jgi:hypothetical protein
MYAQRFKFATVFDIGNEEKEMKDRNIADRKMRGPVGLWERGTAAKRAISPYVAAPSS